MNIFHQIQQSVFDRISKIPMIANSIDESGAIPIQLWRGSNLTNELEAGLKKVGFGIIIKTGSVTQTGRDTWQMGILIELQLNDQFNAGPWGKGVSGLDVAWEIANTLHRLVVDGSTSNFYNMTINSEASEQRFIERFTVTGTVQIKTPQPN